MSKEVRKKTHIKSFIISAQYKCNQKHYVTMCYQKEEKNILSEQEEYDIEKEKRNWNCTKSTKWKPTCV